MGHALVALMQHYKWTMAVTLTAAYWVETGRAFTKTLQDASISVFQPAPFEPGQFKVAMHKIKDKGIRIVVLMDHEDIEAIAAEAAREEMSAGWSWILPGEVASGATVQLQGWLFFRPLLPSDSMQAFAQQVSKYTASCSSHFNITLAADSADLASSAALHDAVLLYAHAATKVLDESGDLYDGKLMTEAVRSTTFQGLGNRAVTLNAQGDRTLWYEVMNYVLRADSGPASVPVGLHNNTSQQYMAYEQAVAWPGNTTLVPIHYVSSAVFSCCISSQAIMPTAAFFAGMLWVCLIGC